jgi:RNA methyltransferase, TrmH family
MKFDDVKKLHQKRYREALGHYLVEGEHSVLELQKAASRNPQLRSCELYVTKQHTHWRSPFTTHVVSEVQMTQISDTKTPQGVVAVVPLLPPAPVTEGERGIYLYEVQDPGNLGTILRTLAWFGHFRCLLSPNSVDPYNPKVVRASMGALFHVPLEIDVEVHSLQGRFGRIASVDMAGEPLQSPAFKACDCYLFGNEARGLPRELTEQLRVRAFTITGGGSIESLNLASAVNMCAYELNR